VDLQVKANFIDPFGSDARWSQLRRRAVVPERCGTRRNGSGCERVTGHGINLARARQRCAIAACSELEGVADAEKGPASSGWASSEATSASCAAAKAKVLRLLIFLPRTAGAHFSVSPDW